jgi:hypothetical protein
VYTDHARNPPNGVVDQVRSLNAQAGIAVPQIVSEARMYSHHARHNPRAVMEHSVTNVGGNKQERTAALW